MAWSVSRYYISMAVCIAHGLPFGEWSIDLNPKQWEKFRDGLDYTERSIEMGEVPPAPLGLGLWFDMLKILGMIVLGGLLIFLIVKLVSGAKIKRKQKQTETKAQEAEMPTALSPYEVLWAHFDKALATGDFRESIRILYQISLKKLADQGLVKAKAEKTNWEYVRELQTGKLYDGFSKLTAIHEYSWYGQGVVARSDFERFEPFFKDFLNSRELEKQP